MVGRQQACSIAHWLPRAPEGVLRGKTQSCGLEPDISRSGVEKGKHKPSKGFRYSDSVFEEVFHLSRNYDGFLWALWISNIQVSLNIYSLIMNIFSCKFRCPTYIQRPLQETVLLLRKHTGFIGMQILQLRETTCKIQGIILCQWEPPYLNAARKRKEHLLLLQQRVRQEAAK